jgi:hypothetical protein
VQQRSFGVQCARVAHADPPAGSGKRRRRKRRWHLRSTEPTGPALEHASDQHERPGHGRRSWQRTGHDVLISLQKDTQIHTKKNNKQKIYKNTTQKKAERPRSFFEMPSPVAAMFFMYQKQKQKQCPSVFFLPGFHRQLATPASTCPFPTHQ